MRAGINKIALLSIAVGLPVSLSLSCIFYVLSTTSMTVFILTILAAACAFELRMLVPILRHGMLVFSVQLL